MKEVLWCFRYIKEKTLGENYKAVYELWRERNPKTRTNVGAKLLLNQKNYILKEKRIPAVDTDYMWENIRHEIWEDHTKKWTVTTEWSQLLRWEKKKVTT
jgi:hypothetical protein